MDESFIRQRMTQLRLKKGVSEYKMSTDMGKSKGYIQSISSGRSLPSISEFLYMCEYLGITPSEFFDTDTSNPALIHEAVEAMKSMSEDDLRAVIALLHRFKTEHP
ncbi:putative Xre family DNA-binding protein [Oscillibacter valericigenes Sjm18-20]|nr:putative Xre family DNA-binding protein [Oscillibacter valericigenes Sjm18-20]